jgi:hypothetical protein
VLTEVKETEKNELVKNPESFPNRMSILLITCYLWYLSFIYNDLVVKTLAEVLYQYI